MQEARSPESCMTHQEMPLLPWQHLGFLEGSPARERARGPRGVISAGKAQN